VSSVSLFDYIEGIIERRNTFSTESFAEYDKFNKQQNIESDFDRAVKQLGKQQKKRDSDE